MSKMNSFGIEKNAIEDLPAHIMNLPSNDVGKFGEEETLKFFKLLAGPQNVFDGPLIRIKDEHKNTQEVELCDGIIRYGDTLFFIQLKTKQTSKSSPSDYNKWVLRKTKDVSRQRKKTISWLQQIGDSKIEVIDGRKKINQLNWKRYNIVFLLILIVDDPKNINSKNGAITTRLNKKEQIEGYPLIRILFNELLLMNQFPNHFQQPLILEYLRMLQYQPAHYLKENFIGFGERFIDPKPKFFPGCSTLISELFKNNRFEKHTTKRILGPIDFLQINIKQDIENYLMDPDEDNPVAIIRPSSENNKPIYIFSRMSAMQGVSSIKEASKRIKDKIYELPYNEQYKELSIDIAQDTIIAFVFYVALTGSNSCFFISISDPLNKLGVPYNFNYDLPSIKFLV